MEPQDPPDTPRGRRAQWVDLVLVLVLAAGVLAAWWMLTSTPASHAAQRTATVTKSTVLSTVTATGTVEAARKTALSFGSSGEVTAVNVTVGQTVAAGDELARIDDSTPRANLRTAEANLVAARKKLTQLEDQQATTTTTAAKAAAGAPGASAAPTDADVAAARAQVVSAEASADAARKALDGVVVTAPYGGVVAAVDIDVGQSTGSSGTASTGGNGTSPSASSPSSSASSSASSASSGSSGAITLVDTSSLSVTVGFSEADVTKVRLGQAAAVSFDAVAGVSANGRVAELSPTSSVSNNVVTYPATVVISAPPAQVKVGMTATVSVAAAERDGVLSLPTAAVRQGSGSTATVQVVEDDGTTQPAQVQTGLVGDDSIEITSGLTEGQRVSVQTTTAAGGAATTGQTRSGVSGAGGTGAGRGGFGGGGLPGGGPPGGPG